MNAVSRQIDLLLIEDNPNDAELVVRALKKCDIPVAFEWCNDGEAAVNFLLRRGEYEGHTYLLPKVILLDLRLPKVDGFELLKLLRESSEFAHTPVVVFTSSNEPVDLDAVYRLGANSCIRKPIAHDEFSLVVVEIAHYWLQSNQIPKRESHSNE